MSSARCAVKAVCSTPGPYIHRFLEHYLVLWAQKHVKGVLDD